MNKSDSIVKGSINDSAIARNVSIAEAFMDAEAVVVVDTSASMGIQDAGLNRSRYQAACDQLARLQGEMPGKVAVVSYSSQAVFCPGGYPVNQGGSTDMVEALRFVKRVDGLMKVVIIADGEPNDAEGTLREASQFVGKIDCVFVGNELSAGRDFMRRLSEATGGVSVTNKTEDLDLELAKNVRLLLTAGA